MSIMFLLIYAILTGASQIILVKASKEIGVNINYYKGFFWCFFSYWMYIGLFLYSVLIIWLFIINKIDIIIAYPIASTTVIFTAIFQCLMDGVFPHFTYWIGVILIICSLVLIQLNN
jgi:drug/metabolite transporter (DMT)-like permease